MMGSVSAAGAARPAAGRLDDLEALFRAEYAGMVRLAFTLVGDADQVTCRTTYIDDRVEAVGGVAGDITYFITVENGLITAYRVALDADTFGTNPWESYKTFVTERSQDDFGAMFAGHPDGIDIIGPVLTEESVELHRQYTQEFVAEYRDSG